MAKGRKATTAADIKSATGADLRSFLQDAEDGMAVRKAIFEKSNGKLAVSPSLIAKIVATEIAEGKLAQKYAERFAVKAKSATGKKGAKSVAERITEKSGKNLADLLRPHVGQKIATACRLVSNETGVELAPVVLQATLKKMGNDAAPFKAWLPKPRQAVAA